MEFIDYYEVMGVAPDASSDDIKRAYRKLARKYHPDVSEASDAEARFKSLGEAWAVLKDPERRREYDELRTLRERGGVGAGEGFRPPPGWRGRSAHGGTGGGYGASGTAGGADWQGDAADFSDFFRDLFGERTRAGGFGAAGGGAGFGDGRPDAPLRGQDVHGTLAVSLQDVHDGASLPLTLRSPRYRADGTVEFDEKTLQVKIPNGVTSGQRIRLRGQGGPGLNGGEAGDLYVEIAIEPDPRFTLDGRDVTLVLPVAPWEAALGATIPVPTLGGEVRLNVPPRSSGGRRLRLKGRGLAAGKGGGAAGDQFVVLRIELPQPDTDQQKALYEEMSRLWPAHDPRADLGEKQR